MYKTYSRMIALCAGCAISAGLYCAEDAVKKATKAVEDAQLKVRTAKQTVADAYPAALGKDSTLYDAKVKAVITDGTGKQFVDMMKLISDLKSKIMGMGIIIPEDKELQKQDVVYANMDKFLGVYNDLIKLGLATKNDARDKKLLTPALFNQIAKPDEPLLAFTKKWLEAKNINGKPLTIAPLSHHKDQVPVRTFTIKDDMIVKSGTEGSATLKVNNYSDITPFFNAMANTLAGATERTVDNTIPTKIISGDIKNAFETFMGIRIYEYTFDSDGILEGNDSTLKNAMDILKTAEQELKTAEKNLEIAKDDLKKETQKKADEEEKLKKQKEEEEKATLEKHLTTFAGALNAARS